MLVQNSTKERSGVASSINNKRFYVCCLFYFVLTSSPNSSTWTLPHNNRPRAFKLVHAHIRNPYRQTLQQELRNVKRHYRLATDSKYIADKLAPYESFWSGDAAAAAGAGATVCLAASVGGVLSPELVFAAAASAQVAAFGRMYFHAHFFLDVFCGCICGAAVPIVIFAFADWQQFGFLQPCVAHLTFVAMYGT